MEAAPSLWGALYQRAIQEIQEQEDAYVLTLLDSIGFSEKELELFALAEEFKRIRDYGE